MMNFEKQKEEALKLLTDWYNDDRSCNTSYDDCDGCGFKRHCTRASRIVKGMEDYDENE